MSDTDNESFRKVSHQIGELRRSITDRVENEDRVREQAFNSLYDELKQYKEDFMFKAEKPLLLDLLLFYDSLNWFQESLIKQEMSPDVIADSFQYLIDEFLEVLYRRDVTPIDQTEQFDRKLHKAVKIQDIEDESLDYSIAQVLKRGFVRDEKLLRPEEVVINRHRQKA